MNILHRIKEKILLWVQFKKISKNFFTILAQRTLAVLGLSNLFNFDSVIKLKNGIKLAQNKKLDVSAVPVTVEVWGNQTYAKEGYPIGPHDCVIDIGANVGSFALYAATKTDGKIFAFEPLPDNVDLIRKSIELNNINSITVVPAAVASQEQDIELQLSYSNAMHSTARSGGSNDHSITVPAINIEKYCTQHGIDKIDYFKIDCEGAEYDIMLNWSPEFVRKLKVIVLEYHDHDQFTFKDLMKFLQDHGFNTREYNGNYIFASRT